ncbi:MAG: metallophosphoesterase family protein [Deltaproteobacteria bacterium]|nr:metallophosphoesterase family protein [Deltaproteobacteria bacterium]
MKKSLIGVISDTHGLIRPESLRALRGAELIIHAGDIGKPEVIETLKSVAPVVAIRGNNDKGSWARRFPETAVVEVGKVRIYVIHDVKELEIDPATAGFRVVISGHSHRPSVLRQNGVLYLNPGSAGPRRFKLPIAVARLRVRGESVSARIIELAVNKGA